VPRELRKTSFPEYQIEIPDILLIEAVHNLRPSEASVHAGEPLIVQVNRTIPVGPQENRVAQQFKQINGVYVIGTDGYLNLGPEYGKVLVAEQNLDEIQRRVESHLARILTNPQVLVTLPNPHNKQIVAGQHLVRMDGSVGLGIYGSVYVNGMTRDQAKCAIERHLATHIHNPQVSLDVLAYNSKKYYVVVDGGGAGEQVVPLPSTGNETVLDAIASIQGLPSVASKADIWIARPAPGCCTDQVLPVNWNSIVQGAQTETNYQVLPGDRIYVKADKMIALDTAVAKFTAPLERVLGFTILGNGAYRTLQVGREAFVQGGN
jgi:polysaccharide export outer membrane protein